MHLILTKEAARLLDVVPNTVRLMVRRGELQAEQQIGTVRVFSLDVVQRVARARAERRQQRGQSGAM